MIMQRVQMSHDRLVYSTLYDTSSLLSTTDTCSTDEKLYVFYGV